MQSVQCLRVFGVPLRRGRGQQGNAYRLPYSAYLGPIGPYSAYRLP